MSTKLSFGPLTVGLFVAASILGSTSLARAFDRLERWLEGAEEQMVVFPTYARLHDDGDVSLPLRVWVFEPEDESSSRKLLVRTLKKAFDIEEPEERERFERRIRPFLFDNERSKTVEMKLAGESYSIGTTTADGHVSKRVRIPSDVAEKALHSDDGRRWLEPVFEAEFGSTEEAIPLIEPEGFSVVSDIDDTIKITEVLDRNAMLRNTFLEEFRAVEGMAPRYRRLAENHEPAFHYLSASPWQLLPFLQKFLDTADFPSGLFHLRSLRVKSISSPLDFAEGSTDYKMSTLERLFEDFPERTFLLVGDSGEHDPEIYGRIAREYSDRVRAIWIRRVEGASNESSRFDEAFRDVPDAKWEVFEDPSTLTLEERESTSNDGENVD